MLVTEYCEGGDLFHALQADDKADSRRFCWYRANAQGERAVGGLAKRIALDVARGLAFLHSRGVVHMVSARVALRRWNVEWEEVGLAAQDPYRLLISASGCCCLAEHGRACGACRT